MMPHADMPFDAEFMDYARKALTIAGIDPDRDWPSARPAKMEMWDVLSEQGHHYAAARKSIPQSDAHWELAAFMNPALRAAIWDLQWGAITTFQQFDFLYVRILGERSRRYLPMLFSAACWNPSFSPDFAQKLLHTLPLDYKCDES